MSDEDAANTSNRSTRQAREMARQLSWLTEAQAALGWGVILVLVALLGVIYLTQASQIAAVGRQVQVLQNELAELRRENSTLEQRIAEAQSLERLQERAIQQGFVQSQPDDIEYLIIENYPIIDLSPTPAVSRPIPEPPQSLAEAIWLALQSRVNDLIEGSATAE